MMSVYPQAPRPTSPIRGGHYSHPPHHVQSSRIQPQSFNERNNQNLSDPQNYYHTSSSVRPKQLWSEHESNEPVQRPNNWQRNNEERREITVQRSTESQNAVQRNQPARPVQRQESSSELQSQRDQSGGKKREIRMFVSKEEQYSICYPNWWNRAEPQPGQVLFVSPRNEPNEFCHNISVVVENLGQDSLFNNFTLYTNVIIQSLMDDSQIVVLESNPTLLSGIQAHQVTYSARHLNTSLIFRQIWLLHEGKSYIVTFTCEASKYTNSIVNMAQEIMATLRLLSVPLIPSFSISDTM